MTKSIVLEKFDSEIMCPACEIITVHKVQKIDEKGNSEFVAYYAECDICDHVEDYSIEDFENLIKEEIIMCSVCGKNHHEHDVNIVDYEDDVCVKCEKNYIAQ